MSYYDDRKEKLKQKLWTAIDNLAESDGFVLTATEDNIQFTTLKSTGWDEHVLELEPLKEAEVRQEVQQLYRVRTGLIAEQASYNTKITARKKTLEQLEAAIAKATGVVSPTLFPSEHDTSQEASPKGDL